MKKKKIIGVTGGFASGKTTVSDLLAAKGAVKIDADAIGHIILEQDNNVKNKLIAIFGTGILTGGAIDRKKLRKIVFADTERMRDLNRVMHPVILDRIERETENAGEGVIVLDAPLLVETGLVNIVDIVVVVSASIETMIKRGVSRGFSEEEVRNVISMQMPIDEKENLADFVIKNDNDMEKTKQGVETLWKKIQSL